MEESRKKTFWDYLRKVVITIIALFVAILFIIAIWGNQPVTLELAYVRGLLIGAAVGFILRSCLISKRKNN